MIRVGVVGYGCWGPNMVRCLAANPNIAMTAICDVLRERLDAAAVAFPGAQYESSVDRIIDAAEIDAIVFTTPAATHYEMACAALRSGKHILVEKPMALSAAEASNLIDEANARNLVLMVDHIYIFSPPIRTIRNVIKSGALGTIHSYQSERINRASNIRDVNVLWDLAIHDVCILDYVFELAPSEIKAAGMRQTCANTSCAEVAVRFSGGMSAHIKVDWSAPDKIRRIVISGTKKTLVFDDLQHSEKIKVLDTASRYANPDVIPTENSEPLQAVTDHFASCVLEGHRPLTDGEAGLRVVRLLETADQSMAAAGRSMPLRAEPAKMGRASEYESPSGRKRIGSL